MDRDDWRMFFGILAVLVMLPIWLYLMYWLLRANNAGDLQMFLYWVYVPLALFVGVAMRLMEKKS